jgi:glycosyltransferase involved in cell wall biosynthesis
MKIGYECMLTGPQDTGVGGSIRDLLQAMAETAIGDTFTVFTHARAAEGLPRGRGIDTLRCALPAGGRPARIAWQQCGLRRLLRRNPVDVYHGPGYIVPEGLPVPSVVTVYDTIALERPALTAAFNALHYRWAVPRAVLAAHRVVTPSDRVRRRLIAITDVDPRKVTVIPLGIAPEFRPLDVLETSERLRDLGLDIRPFLLCVGNIERKKNLDAALYALEHRRRVCPEAKLVLAGRPGNDSRRLRRQIRAQGLRDAVVFTGYLPRRTLVALYNRALALLYPSHEEGFGLPPLEAMACGTPALVSNVCALREVAGPAALLIDPDDAPAWAAGVARLVAEPNLSSDLRARGLEHAKRYSWQRSAQETLALYREVLACG